MQVSNLSGLSGATAIAAGFKHSLALKTDATVWAWGQNSDGQLGDGTNDDRPFPLQVSNLSEVTAIAAGDSHSLALKTDGTVWAWGNNDDGQLGDGTIQDRATPVQVRDLSDVTTIAAGGMHSLAQRVPLTQLTVQKILVHPDRNRLRLFNLRIDGVTVAANINAGTTGPHLVSPGNHTVGETGGTNTPIGAFHIVIGGDCADNGIVSLALGDNKTCTITTLIIWRVSERTDLLRTGRGHRGLPGVFTSSFSWAAGYRVPVRSHGATARGMTTGDERGARLIPIEFEPTVLEPSL